MVQLTDQWFSAVPNDLIRTKIVQYEVKSFVQTVTCDHTLPPLYSDAVKEGMIHWLFTIYMEKPVGRWFVQMESKIPILEISVWGGVYHLNNRPNLPKEPRATLTSAKWRLKSLYSTRL